MWRTKILLSSVQGNIISKGKRRIAKPSTSGSAIIQHGLIQLLSTSASGFKTKRAKPPDKQQNHSQTTYGQTWAPELTRPGMALMYATENVGDCSLATHSFHHINWWPKASPTSFAPWDNSGGGWMKENLIPSATLPDWLNRPSPPASVPQPTGVASAVTKSAKMAGIVPWSWVWLQ